MIIGEKRGGSAMEVEEVEDGGRNQGKNMSDAGLSIQLRA